MSRITVTLKYYNLIKEMTGTGSEKVTLSDETTLGQLLDNLSRRYGDAFREMILTPEGALSTQARLFINGNTVTDELLHSPLEENTEIAIFLAVSGG